MAKLTPPAIITIGVVSFFIAAVWEILIGEPLLGFWLNWVGWFTVIAIVYRRL